MKRKIFDEVTDWQAVDRLAERVTRPAPKASVLSVRVAAEVIPQSRAGIEFQAGRLPLIQTGDKRGFLTFIGVTHGGKALCRCDCGRVDVYPMEQLAAAVRCAPKKLKRMRCNDCLQLYKAILKPVEPRAVGDHQWSGGRR